MSNVYTYYMEVPGLWSDSSQRALIDLWKRSWAKHGWTPEVLHEDHAKTHPEYAKFKQKFWSFPTPFGHDYEGGCFMRWVAMAMVGGGMMVDYDVMNYGFSPVNPETNDLVVYSDTKMAPWCGAILGTAVAYARMARLFCSLSEDKGDWLEDHNLYHCEDQVFLRHMLCNGKITRPNWLRWQDGMTIFPNLSGPLVHYPSKVMMDSGYIPKHEHIPKLKAL